MDQYGNVVPIPRGVPNLGFRGGIQPLVDLERYDNSRWCHETNIALSRDFGSELAVSAQVPHVEATPSHVHLDARTPNLSYGGIAPPQF